MLRGIRLIDATRQGKADPPTGIRTLGLDGTHHWIVDLGPGTTTFRWPVDPACLNLEGAVNCSWTVASADQALFFASNALCALGESTWTIEPNLSAFENITSGTIAGAAQVLGREGDTLLCRYDLTDYQGVLAASVDARIEIHR